MSAIKFNTRKINQQFGVDAEDFRYIVTNEPKLISPRCNRRVADWLKSNGFAKFDNLGPGWDLQVFVNEDKLQKAGYIG